MCSETRKVVFEVAGQPMVDDGSKGNPALDWLLAQQRVLLKNGVLTWHDAMGQFPDAQAMEAELLLENGLSRHAVGLVFKVQGVAQTPVRANLNFKTPLLDVARGDLQKWKGTFFLDVAVDQAAPIESVFKTLSLDVDLTKPQGKLWVDFDNGLVQRSVLDARVAKLRFSNDAVNAPPFDMVNTSALIEVVGEHFLLKPEAISVHRLNGQIAGLKQFGPTDLSATRKAVDEGVLCGGTGQSTGRSASQINCARVGPACWAG